MQNPAITEVIAFIHQHLHQPNLDEIGKRHLQFLLNLSQKLAQNPTLISHHKFDLKPIPLTQNGYDSLFLASDCESDNPQNWQKITHNGKAIEVQSGDILIQFK